MWPEGVEEELEMRTNLWQRNLRDVGMSGKVFLVEVYFYCEDVASSFSTTCIRVLNLNPGRYTSCRSKWPPGLRRGFAAAHSMELWVRTPLGTWMFVSCDCRVLSGRDLCVGLINPPEESYRVWCVQWVGPRSPVREVMTRNRAEAPQERK